MRGPAACSAQSDVLGLRALCRDVAVAEPVLRYAARLVTRASPDASGAPPLVRRAVRYGAGVRGGQALVLAAKAVALLEGRAQVAFADIAAHGAAGACDTASSASFEGEADGITTDRVVGELIESVPRGRRRSSRRVRGS